ncbi:MAG: TIGR01906 family membrane protein [Oscillospiraceae bacterium]|jgi:integral membrane protein (TIGR01906 family)|nr:TIGR01906 family membrane protein [Oscillospiraceae bacterium]
MKKAHVVLGVMNGLLLVLLAVALGLAFIHITGIPYRLEPFADKMALRNYQAVMRFLSPFVNEPFALPDLAYSADGSQHFADCKPLFNGVYQLGLIGLSGVLALFLALRKRNKRKYWLASGITSFAAPAILLIYMAADFNRVFLWFHRVFFNNSLWIFDPEKDPIIRILPAQFFMHCGIFIASCVVLLAAVQFVLCVRCKPSSKKISCKSIT